MIETCVSGMSMPFSVSYSEPVETLSGSTALVATLTAHGMLPSDEEAQGRQEALSLLKQTILGTSDENASISLDIPMVIVPVGSYALGSWTSQSDINCLCIGTISSKTFFELVLQRLQRVKGQGVRIMKKVEDYTGTTLELLVNGVAMDLQYCSAALIIKRFPEIPNLSAADPVFDLPVLSLRKLKPFRDSLYLERVQSSLPTFWLAHRCIKLWAIQRGIYSSEFGYLNGVQITLMLSYICRWLSYSYDSHVDIAAIVTNFFHHYAHFDWKNEILYDAFFHQKKPRYHRSERDSMVVLGFHEPNSNVASTVTAPGLRTLIREFEDASKRLSQSGVTWDEFFCSAELSCTLNQMSYCAASFLRTHKSYVKIDIHFWGRTMAKGRGLIEQLKLKCSMLNVDIDRELPNLDPRIWPARFTDMCLSDMSAGNEYRACYLIGLSGFSNNGIGDNDPIKLTLEKLFDRYLAQLKMDAKHYDSNTCWVYISLAKPAELENLRIDTHDWAQYAEKIDIDSDDEDDHVGRTSDSKSPRGKGIVPTAISASKLRPASDVLNRIRWDTNLDPAEYIVGYEDRFLGPKEINLVQWKTEQTDEDFIPQHRILYFKKVDAENGTDEVVWERSTRIDKVFGSGVGVGYSI